MELFYAHEEEEEKKDSFVFLSVVLSSAVVASLSLVIGGFVGGWKQFFLRAQSISIRNDDRKSEAGGIHAVAGQTKMFWWALALNNKNGKHIE